jgi:hypothetical protein
MGTSPPKKESTATSCAFFLIKAGKKMLPDLLQDMGRP